MSQSLKPKRVLLLIETLNRGGIENVLLRLIPRLKQNGWSGIIVTIRDGGEMVNEYKRAGIEVVSLNQRFFFHPKTLLLIYKQIKQANPDIIMTTLFKADAIGRLFLRFTVSIPVVPYLVTTYNHPRYWIARVFEWFTKPLASKYIANSEAVSRFYANHLGIRQDKIVIAPNGVDTETFTKAKSQELYQSLQLPKDAFIVTCVANLAPNKGQSDLIKAFDTAFGSNPSAYLLLVGDGAERETLNQLKEQSKAKKRILLLGRRTDVPAILKITNVFALPTLFEGMSTALLEAMAAQKTIVTTNIPENKVLLTQNKTALLVPPRNPKQLAAALETLYQDQTLATKLCQAAFAHVQAQYSIDTMAQTFTNIFDQICQFPNRNNKIPVIHIISSLESGGAENMLLRTLPLLNTDALDHVVITLFRAGELAPELQKRGVTVINIGAKSVFDISALKRLRREINHYNPGLVITYLFYAGLVGRLYLRKRIKAPIVLFLRTTYNSPIYGFARLIERITKGMVGHYFANSEAVKDYYHNHIGVAKNKITVIPNGIDLNHYQTASGSLLEKKLNLPAKRTIITCVANLAVNKGHAYLLEAFETLYQTRPELYLLIVGEGKERTNLHNQIKSYASKNQIKFLGRRSDVPEILALTDIFVLPTFFEGLSNAILEAMAAGNAVITTDIPENRIIIEQNKTGLLIPTKDAPAITTAINRLLSDRVFSTTLGKNAQSYIKKNFDLHEVANQLKKAIWNHARV